LKQIVPALLLALASPQAAPRTLIVVDSTAPVRDRAGAIDQTRQLLASASARGDSACVDLQASGVAPLADCLAERYLANLFPDEHRVYSGVSMRLVEASAIVAGNESVRDAIIHRECADAGRSSGCEGKVHAAAIARVADAQNETDGKLAALARIVAERHPATVVLVTAGLPFQHEPKAVREVTAAVRADGARFVHAALESPFKIEGILRDAAAALTSRTGGRSVSLRAGGNPAALINPAATRPPADATNGPPSGVGADGALLSMVRTYAARYPAEMRFILAHERYDQEVRSRAGSYGTTAGMVTARRSTEASVAFAHVADGAWLMSRQVSQVDGRPVESTPLAIDQLGEAEVLRQLKQTVEEGARWNIGSVHRTINTPTLVLWFLVDPLWTRFRFRSAGVERTAAGMCRVIRYEEVGRPAIMDVNGSRVPSSGRIWVLPDSGAVVRTELVLEAARTPGRGPSPGHRATIAVEYMYYPDARLWVPATMTERYEDPAVREADVIVTRATYSAYQRFGVSIKVK